MDLAAEQQRGVQNSRAKMEADGCTHGKCPPTTRGVGSVKRCQSSRGSGNVPTRGAAPHWDSGRPQLAAVAGSQLAAFGVFTLLALVLGPAAVGRYALTYAVFTLLSVLIFSGLRSGVVRSVGRSHRDGDGDGLRGAVLLAVAVPTAIAAVCAGLILALTPLLVRQLSLDSGVVSPLRVIAVALVCQTFTDAALAATQGFGTTRYAARIGVLAEPVIRLGLTGLGLAVGAGLSGALIALVLSTASTAVLSTVVLSRLVGSTAELPTYRLGEDITFSTVSWAGAAAAAGLVWADTLVLGVIGSSAQVGVYTIAMRAEGRLNRLRGDYQRMTVWSARLTIPGLVALIVLPRDVLTLFGPGFATAAAAMVVLAGGKLGDAITGPSGLLLSLFGQSATSAQDGVAVLLVNLGLNLYLIPRHGIIGAAWAWAVSIWLLKAAQGTQVWLTARVLPVDPDLIRALAAGDAALLAVLMSAQLLKAPWRLPFSLLVIITTYLGATATLGISSNERPTELRLGSSVWARLCRRGTGSGSGSGSADSQQGDRPASVGAAPTSRRD